MKPAPGDMSCELLVMGTGMAGMAAALFASNLGIDVIHVGGAGSLNFASGLLDFMGVHPIGEGRTWQNPYAAIEALVRDCPRHPYARIHRREMEQAWGDFLGFLERAGLDYRADREKNVRVLTSVGTLKTTYAVPESMGNGIQALVERAPCTLIDFHGLKGFSGRQIVEALRADWPALDTHRVDYPDRTGELFPEQIARSLELADHRRDLAERIRPLLGRARYVGVPAVLGLYRPGEVFRDFQQLVGRPLFEIPTMPPAVTGLRMRSAFEQHLHGRGVRAFYQHRVTNAETRSGGFRFEIGTSPAPTGVYAKGAILATGRFFGKGLYADRKEIRETVFGLPVSQPPERGSWHRKGFLDPAGHAINRAGIETDHRMRPLDQKGNPAFSNLFAAGAILAHQDWIRMKCGSGLAITTAYKAVQSFAHGRPK